MTQFYGTLTPEKTEREEKNMQLVRKGAGECMVLLENDGVLPLKKIGRFLFTGIFLTRNYRKPSACFPTACPSTKPVTRSASAMKATSYSFLRKSME